MPAENDRTEAERLAQWLSDGDEAARRDAAERLARLAEAAQPAAIELVRAMGDDDATVRDWAFAALESLGPPRAEDADALGELLNDPRLDVAYWTATLLGRLGAAGPANVVRALGDAVDSHSELAVRQRAAWALRQFGSAAKDALPELRRAAGSDDPRLSRLAQEAISAIEE